MSDTFMTVIQRMSNTTDPLDLQADALNNLQKLGRRLRRQIKRTHDPLTDDTPMDPLLHALVIEDPASPHKARTFVTRLIECIRQRRYYARTGTGIISGSKAWSEQPNPEA